MGFVRESRRLGSRPARRRRLPGGVSALAAALLLAAGCLTNPTGPSEDAGGAGWSLSPPAPDPLVLTVDGGVADFTSVPPESVIDVTLDALIQAVDTGLLTGPGLSASAEIDGSKGGSLKVGRFTLTVPGGAFDGTATVTCRLPDSTIMLCDLSVSAGTPNRFKVPVVLTLDTNDLQVDDGTLSIFWYDPAVDGWRAMPTTLDSKNRMVSAALTHFSRYYGGKAGW